MQILQLEQILTCLREGSFSKAGRVMHLTQQGISKSVRNLEKELRAELIINTEKTLKPTELGLQIIPKFQNILDEYEMIKAIIDENEKDVPFEGYIKLAYSYFNNRGSIFDPQMIKEFEASFPNIHIEKMAVSNETCIHALSRSLVDCSFSLERIDGYTNIRMANAQLRIAMSESNALADKNGITKNDLNNQKIATPIALGQAFVAFSEFLSSVNNATLVNLTPNINEEISFINNGGIIFVLRNSVIENTSTRILTKSIDRSFLAEVPVYFSFDQDNAPACLPHFIRFLKERFAVIKEG